ncbi:MAG: DUF502 domain-containing protein [Candidatus Zixiibacteriota bacterium]|nr:MAG: DUF502 domain-containing protein [candidate division Zixibacteria bacterium]HDL03290.1 DUF502 domain-containing protein [candidate division Zixibacteria bacterium]
MSVFKIVKDIIKRQFLAGVLVVIPLILTYVVLRFLFETIDGILSPLIMRAFQYHIPGLGIVVTILLILLAGFFTRNLIGAKLYKYGDRILANIPVIRVVYLATKQLVEAVTLPSVKAFKEVVMVEYPRVGLYAIGFATNNVKLISNKAGTSRMVGIFIPSTPTPVSGFVIFAPEDEIITLNISVEDALKLLVSGGIVAPPELAALDHGDIAEVN